MPEQVEPFYPDLLDPAVESALALVHSRFSTNTFPSWDRAHPYRYVAHNGEINTLRGNINWMHARESLLKSDLFGDDIKKLLPIINEDGSDSAMFDNCLEFLVLGGRSLPHAMMMMIPEPWSGHESMSEEKKAFYEYHSCLIEPWDGPASIAFTDGVKIGAVLDRNGLRPSRYYVTKDDRVIMASEVGVLDVAPDRVLQKGRLQPGRMFLVDTELGRIVTDEEIKQKIATEHPYRLWLKAEPRRPRRPARARRQIVPSTRATGPRDRASAPAGVWIHVRGFAHPARADGARRRPAARLDGHGHAAGGALEQAAVALQLFQATLRAGHQSADRLHPRGNHHLDVHDHRPRGQPARPAPRKLPPDSAERPRPEQRGIRALARYSSARFQVDHTADPFQSGRRAAKGLEKALDKLFAKASQAIKDGHNILILSDRGIDAANAAIPALLAVAGVHHHLIRKGTRTRVGLVLESGEPREVHHFALLIGYGAGAINPYLAFETLDDMIRQGILKDIDHETGGSRTTARPSPRAWSKRWPRWASRPSKAIAARRSSKRSASITRSSTSISRGPRRRSKASASTSLPRKRASVTVARSPIAPSRKRRSTSGGQYQWRTGGRSSLVQSRDDPQTAALDAHGQLQGLQGILGTGQQPVEEPLHVARPVRVPVCAAPDSDRGSRVGRSPLSNGSRPAR